jgi:molybdopterin-guanine dinucleotide biosynthesis adapter protein
VPGRPTKVIAIVGTSKTGKTTLIEKLIPLLTGRGLRVATVKHHHKDFEIDIPGKDTYRHKKAGAVTTIISAPGKIGIVSDVSGDLPLADIVSRYTEEADILIAEGYKKANVAKIEVYRAQEGRSPVCLGDKDLIAIVTEDEIDAGVPLFKTGDIPSLAAFIVSHFHLDR